MKKVIREPLSIYQFGKIYRKSNGQLYRGGERGNLIKLTKEEVEIYEARKKEAQGEKG